jgi:alpha-amylase
MSCVTEVPLIRSLYTCVSRLRKTQLHGLPSPSRFLSGCRAGARAGSYWRVLVVSALLAAGVQPAAALDESPPPILQWFESSYRTIEERAADVFLAGYGFVWVPPPYRADQGEFSVGYDVYDRFDLGAPGKPTLYGTEEGLKALARMLHRAGLSLHVDFVINHNGFSNLGTPGFVAAGGYSGFAITLPNDIDGDFHSAFAGGDDYERLAGLIDIAHEKNHRFIRSPVGPDSRNLKAGTTERFGRLANVPDPRNRRFYPDIGHNTIFLFDPKTNESNIAVHAFNIEDPMAGDPVVENATGYLMRNAQWLIQVIGADGLRIDAAKHVQGFVLDFLDRAVYRQNPRKLLDGSQSDVFSYSEVYDANPAVLLPHVKKNIDHSNPGRIGGNRDTLDFKLYFALKDGLESTGIQGAWQRIKDAALDMADDTLHNGSAGVTFIENHDVFKPYALEHVAQAYTLMMPGNTIVYFNGREFGDNRDFPKPGRSDALSVGRGSLLTRLVAARNTHGRGNYAERWDGTDGLFAFERQGSALVLLSNRGDAGFDSRTLTNVGFRPGTLLTELSGNAADPAVNPDRGGHTDIPQVLRVFEEGGVSKVNVRFQRPATVSNSGQFDFHGKGLLVYGVPVPQSDAGIELTNVAEVLPGRVNPANARENGMERQADLSVIRTDSFEVRIRTRPVRLLGSDAMRDVDADGDEALLRLDAGVDVNGNGAVDFRTPGGTEYGFERFVTKHSPLIGNHDVGAPRGDGEFRQVIDARRLQEGMHFLVVRVYRHQPPGSPAVFNDFKKVIYIDRSPPVAAFDSFHPLTSGPGDNEVWIRSVDGTADNIHVLPNLRQNTSEADILAAVTQGKGKLDRIDRALFKGVLRGLPKGENSLTIVTFERTGRKSIKRQTAVVP